MDASPPSPSRSVRAIERAVLVYSPLWMLIVGVVGVSGLLPRWGDLEHLVLGIGLALPICLLPWLAPRLGSGEEGVPLGERYATRFVVFIVGMTMVQMYAGSWLFFDRLGMQYTFHVTWTWNRSPVFLYPLTIAYFATYYVVMQLALRRLPPALSRGAGGLVALALISYAVAFAETYVMAADVLRPYFLYRDKSFMLRWGSLCYGTVFFVSVPLATMLTERVISVRHVLVQLTLRNAVALACYQLYAIALPLV